ncbi:AfsR/SARP family transcriptional regulator [Actinopolyspora mortivallis]|uniref:OmpR/PhoB-type domain-containing protein n=1 Tax=Actinopolyspora mortivallis TaxID=33906 RepID=A0A2T0H053_ACTMO|nr:AfsR/SARP family transcriptional regulator [Actinopolyspora mortivallis]PRW64748.1 hypothetical protein CEP50_02600 [Actinopolyspora mortivallis]
MIHFRILGGVYLCDASGASFEVPGTLRRTLLALLLVNRGQTVPHEQLANELWPERVPSCYVNALEAHVARLRRDLERVGTNRSGYQLIATNRTGYSIHLDKEELDLDVANSLLTKAHQIGRSNPEEAIELMDRAFDLWRGPALAGVSELSQRLRAHALQIEERYVLDLEKYVDLHLECGHDEYVIVKLRELTIRYPHRERFVEQLITALGRQGRKVEAADLFRSVRTCMIKDFGIEPSTDLNRTLQEALNTS